MTSSHIRFARRLAAGAVALATALSLVQAAHAQSAPASARSLLPPAGNLPYLLGHGDGVQIYQCNATAAGFAWTFVAPRANLTDARGRVIITHFGGPTWQANDGSKVVGTLVSSLTVSPNAIPWLLLSTTATPAPHGGGLLADATFVQRLFTVGGLAPAASTCDAKAAGARSEVPYTAEYLFWKSRHAL
jgi:FtsP/CotA-like multicopper oxidase with cupredoxin domain